MLCMYCRSLRAGGRREVGIGGNLLLGFLLNAFGLAGHLLVLISKKLHVNIPLGEGHVAVHRSITHLSPKHHSSFCFPFELSTPSHYPHLFGPTPTSRFLETRSSRKKRIAGDSKKTFR